jgi:N-acetylneuraminate synthase/N,N'-diacetyllegionaminate synthase
MLSRLELSEQDYIRIADRCRDRSILFLATPFSPEDLGTLDVLSVPAIKIASTDLTNPPLLTAAARTGLPLILSTGASTRKELDEVGERLMELGVLNRTVLLHCISAYPAPLEALNLQAIPALARALGRPVGFSDHTISRESGGWAVAAGACLLEKHFTLDARQAGPDHAMSLTPPQLKEYIEAARRSEVSRGTGELGMNEIEQEVRRVAGRSLVAAKFIPRGAVIEPEMVSAKRPAGGIHPAEIGRFVGRRARNSIPAETVLSWDMVH